MEVITHKAISYILSASCSEENVLADIPIYAKEVECLKMFF